MSYVRYLIEGMESLKYCDTKITEIVEIVKREDLPYW